MSRLILPVAVPLSARLACLFRGHEPSVARDWVGRPLECERCGAVSSDMSRRAWERLCGRAALADWNAAAAAELDRRTD